MNRIKNKTQLLGKSLLTLILALFVVSMTGYFFTPVYNFATPKPFAGDTIYNPYKEIDLGTLKRAVFHIHSNKSDGKNSPQEMVQAYQQMGYDIISLSDHNTITPAGIDPERELKTYEHGLNGYRLHSVVFGANKTSKFILPFTITLSQRYETLRRLDSEFPIVVLNHPGTTRTLSASHMEQLSHYKFIEADDDLDKGLPPLWDAALSAGHYSYVMANDDLHNLSKPYAIGHAMTFVATDKTDAVSVIAALEKGHNYALRVRHPSQNVDSVLLPKLESISFEEDTIRVAFTDPATILFIGQQGDIRKYESGALQAKYGFRSNDTYIRVEARFENETFIYLNPIARTTDPNIRPVNASYATINWWLTILSYALRTALVVLSIWCIRLLWNKKKTA